MMMPRSRRRRWAEWRMTWWRAIAGAGQRRFLRAYDDAFDQLIAEIRAATLVGR